jgi:hypothetical protein
MLYQCLMAVISVGVGYSNVQYFFLNPNMLKFNVQTG